MKKLIMTILVTLVFTLAACNDTENKQEECPDGQILENDVCVDEPVECPDGQILENDVCVDEPVECPDGQILENDVCVDEPLVCPDGKVEWNGLCVDEVLVCDDGYHEEDGECVVDTLNCPFYSHEEDGQCVENDNHPEYYQQALEPYEGRDIVTDACDHLDNIGEWQPVWCDEFDYVGLPQTSLWNYDVGGHGWGNNEAQYYTNADSDNVYVKDGMMTITAIKENYSGNNYTSTRLISKDKGDFLYGKIQVRAILPGGRGTWPAIWMLPTNWEYGGWPHSGEIDIMEYVGYDPNRVHTTIHTGAYHHSIGTQVGISKLISNPEELFHVYEIEWEPGVIRSYIDGVLYAQFDHDPGSNFDITNSEAWPFDKEFHLLINIAIGGGWGGVEGIDDSIFPQDFILDYVRVYQKDYAGMDQSQPEAPTQVEVKRSGATDIYVDWEDSVDDVLVKEYELYLDDTLIDITSVSGYLFEELDISTSYELKIVAVDFAGNKSTPVTQTIETITPIVPKTTDRIENEEFVDMSGVQLEGTSDVGGGQNVGWTDTNDYMTYIVESESQGDYTLSFRVASEPGAAFNFYIDDELIETITVSSTGGWQSWITMESSIFNLSQGIHELKIVMVGSGVNFNYMEFNLQ